MQCPIKNEHKSIKFNPAILLALVVLFIISRSVYLDRDLPSTVLSSYVAIDELYYTMPAFNLYHYGETIHNVVPFIENDLQPTGILENVMTFFSLSLFGNNYYGLRMASVLAAAIIFVLLFLILKKIINNNMYGDDLQIIEKPSYILFFVMAYILCDFSFLMAGRAAEPTIFRMLAMVILIYVASFPFLSAKLESKWCSLLLGFLSLAAVIFVYVYNTFVFCAFALSVFIWAYKGGFKNAIKQSVIFLTGSVLCLLTYQLFIDVSYHSSLADIYKHLIPYQNRMGLGISLTDKLGSYMLNIIFLFLTNIFRFNIILLFIFVMALPVFIKKVKAEHNNFDILICNLVLFLIMQSIIINDYPLRKLIILLPLAAIVITSAYTYLIRHLAEFINTEAGRRLINLSCFAAGIISLAVTALYFSPGLSGESISITGNFMYLNLGVFIIISSFILLAYFFAVRIPKAIVIMLLIFMLLPNLYMDCRYVFCSPTYYFRDAMISMGEKVNGKITLGGCSYGFRLYNESIPVLDFYMTKYSPTDGGEDLYNTNFDRAFSEGISTCSIAYTEENMDTPLGSDYMNKHGLKLEAEYELGDCVDTDIGLYYPAPK